LQDEPEHDGNESDILWVAYASVNARGGQFMPLLCPPSSPISLLRPLRTLATEDHFANTFSDIAVLG